MTICRIENSTPPPKKKKICLETRHFSHVFSSAEHEYFSPINQKSKHFRQKAIFVDICRFFLKYFYFWLMGSKYSCSADENTSKKCLVIKKNCTVRPAGEKEPTYFTLLVEKISICDMRHSLLLLPRCIIYYFLRLGRRKLIFFATKPFVMFVVVFSYYNFYYKKYIILGSVLYHDG